jgi:hypothetical protein
MANLHPSHNPRVYRGVVEALHRGEVGVAEANRRLREHGLRELTRQEIGQAEISAVKCADAHAARVAAPAGPQRESTAGVKVFKPGYRPLHREAVTHLSARARRRPDVGYRGDTQRPASDEPSTYKPGYPATS